MPISIGAEANTITISSVDDWMNKLSGKDLSGITAITVDANVKELDFSKIDTEKYPEGILPAEKFSGTFNGNGVVIKNVYMSKSSGDVGLFCTVNGTFSNVVITDSTFESTENGNWLGSLICCTNDKTSVNNVYVSETVKVYTGIEDSSYTGGIIGGGGGSKKTYTLEVNSCVFAGTVSIPNGKQSGGIIGSCGAAKDYSHNITINNCLVTGAIHGDAETSGFVGVATNDTVVLNNCIYAGGPEGDYFISYPFTRTVKSVTLIDCYTTYVNSDKTVCNNIKFDADDSGVTYLNEDITTDYKNLEFDIFDSRNKLIGLDAVEITGFTRRDGDIMIPKGLYEVGIRPITFTQYLYDGAAVRLDTPTGLRFTAVMGKAYLDSFKEEGKTVTHGIIIAPTDYIVDGEFTVDALGSVDKYLEIEAEKYVNDPEADGYYKYTGVIVKINTWNYERAFSAIAYVKVVDDETQEVTYYYSDYDEAVNSRSVAAIAEDAYNDPDGGYSDDEMDILAGFFQTGAAQ